MNKDHSCMFRITRYHGDFVEVSKYSFCKNHGGRQWFYQTHKTCRNM